jgi:hypothetical protein
VLIVTGAVVDHVIAVCRLDAAVGAAKLDGGSRILLGVSDLLIWGARLYPRALRIVRSETEGFEGRYRGRCFDGNVLAGLFRCYAGDAGASVSGSTFSVAKGADLFLIRWA